MNQNKTTLLVCLIMVSNLLFSQIKKNDKFLGGAVAFNYVHYNFTVDDTLIFENYERYAFSITPRFGYAISDKFLASVGIGYTWIPKYTDQGTTFSQFYHVGSESYIRYFKTIAKNFCVFSQVYFNYSQSKAKLENANGVVSHTKGKTIMTGITPGLTYFFNDRIALDCQLGYFGYQRIVGITDYTFGGTSPDYSQKTVTENLTFFFSDYAPSFGVLFKLNKGD